MAIDTMKHGAYAAVEVGTASPVKECRDLLNPSDPAIWARSDGVPTTILRPSTSSAVQLRFSNICFTLLIKTHYSSIFLAPLFIRPLAFFVPSWTRALVPSCQPCPKPRDASIASLLLDIGQLTHCFLLITRKSAFATQNQFTPVPTFSGSAFHRHRHRHRQNLQMIFPISG